MTKYFLSIVFLFNVIFTYSQTKSLDFTIDSEVFNSQREISIFVPDNYEVTDSIPVVYLFDAQWEQFYNLTTSSLDYLTTINEFPKCMIVGIKSTDRRYELTPTPVNEDWKMPQLGGAKLLENHLQNEVIPFVDSLFHPQDFRIGIGHSLGGTFLLNSLIDCPDLFNAYICISPNLQIDDEEIVLKIGRNLEKIKHLKKFLFTSMGTEGSTDNMFLPPLTKLDSIMISCNADEFNWHFSIHQGLSHGTTPLMTINQALLELSKKWKISKKKKDDFIKSEEAFFKQVSAFYADLSSWTGYYNSPDLNTFYDLGYFCSSQNEHREALSIYDWGIIVFPDEALLYYKKGEILEKMEALDKAKELYSIAQEKLDLQKESLVNQENYEYYSKIFQDRIEALTDTISK